MSPILAGLVAAVFLAGAVALSARSAAPVRAANTFVPGQYATVSGTEGYALKVRQEPNSASDVSVYLPGRTKLRILAGPLYYANGWAWYRVTGFDKAGTHGWCVGYYLAPLSDPVLDQPNHSPRPPYRVLARVTAYNGVEYGNPWGGLTRLGTMVRPGVVATDPSYIPLGSEVMIEGMEGIFVAEDTGSGVWGYHVDVYMPTYPAALQFGSRWVYITVFGRPHER